MEIKYSEYTSYNEAEILNLYRSVGWVNYVDNPKMVAEA